MTRGELISELAATLGATHEARFIVDEVLGSALAPLHTEVGEGDAITIWALAARRRAGEPLQYVLGHWGFRTLDLLVDRRVLIPRPETEQVVEVALGEVRQLHTTAPTIIDAGTGSGAIALSLAIELAASHPGCRLWATDASTDALALAGENLHRVRQQHEGAVLPVLFVEGFWLTPIPAALQGSVDLIVSNPPYVAVDEWPDLPVDVQREPRQALVAETGTDGTPGLGDVEVVLRQAFTWLSRPGAVVIELAPHQAEAGVLMARSMGYGDVRVEPDLARRPRALVGRVS